MILRTCKKDKKKLLKNCDGRRKNLIKKNLPNKIIKTIFYLNLLT